MVLYIGSVAKSATSSMYTPDTQQEINQSINQPTNQPANQSINQPTNQSINQSINPDQHCRIPGIPHFLAQSNHQKLVIPGIGDKSRLYLFGVYYVFFFKRC